MPSYSLRPSQVYYREQAAAMYSPWVYGIVLGGVETPYVFAQVLLFVGIVYPMVDYAGSECMGWDGVRPGDNTNGRMSSMMAAVHMRQT